MRGYTPFKMYLRRWQTRESAFGGVESFGGGSTISPARYCLPWGPVIAGAAGGGFVGWQNGFGQLVLSIAVAL